MIEIRQEEKEEKRKFIFENIRKRLDSHS